MNRVYLLSDYGEYGAEEVVATLDPTKLEAMLRKYCEGGVPEVIEEMIREMRKALDTGEEIALWGHNLSKGWGGVQLHVVDLK